MRVRLGPMNRKALYFDGADDKLVIANNNGVLDITKHGSRTLEMLIYIERLPPDTGVDDYNVLFEDKFTGGLTYRIYDYGKFVVKNNGVWEAHVSANTIRINKWIHFVHVFNDLETKIYIDAVLDTARRFSDLLDSSDYKTVGTGSTSYFKGFIAYIRVYNRALSESEIRHNYYHPDKPVGDGLVLWLDSDSIDEANGVWRDKTIYGNDGTIYGARTVFI